MQQELVALVLDGEVIGKFLDIAHHKAYIEAGLTDEEIAFYKGALKAIEWVTDVGGDEPTYEDTV